MKLSASRWIAIFQVGTACPATTAFLRKPDCPACVISDKQRVMSNWGNTFLVTAVWILAFRPTVNRTTRGMRAFLVLRG